MDGKRVLYSLLLAAALAASSAQAATVEISGMLAYSKSNFGDDYRSMQRRYTASIDFKFTPVSALQIEYTNSLSKISYQTDVSRLIGGSLPYLTNDASTFKDRIYSFNWVQNLVPAKWMIQPYIVLGGGKMRRLAIREIPEFRVYQSEVQNVTTGTGGVGLRIFLTKNTAIKGEMKTYVPKFKFSKWKESQQLSVGLSWVF